MFEILALNPPSSAPYGGTLGGYGAHHQAPWASSLWEDKVSSRSKKRNAKGRKKSRRTPMAKAARNRLGRFTKRKNAAKKAAAKKATGPKIRKGHKRSKRAACYPAVRAKEMELGKKFAAKLATIIKKGSSARGVASSSSGFVDAFGQHENRRNNKKRRANAKRRRNRTGYPFSGKSYRPRIGISRSKRFSGTSFLPAKTLRQVALQHDFAWGWRKIGSKLPKHRRANKKRRANAKRRRNATRVMPVSVWYNKRRNTVKKRRSNRKGRRYNRRRLNTGLPKLNMASLKAFALPVVGAGVTIGLLGKLPQQIAQASSQPSLARGLPSAVVTGAGTYGLMWASRKFLKNPTTTAVIGAVGGLIAGLRALAAFAPAQAAKLDVLNVLGSGYTMPLVPMAPQGAVKGMGFNVLTAEDIARGEAGGMGDYLRLNGMGFDASLVPGWTMAGMGDYVNVGNQPAYAPTKESF